MTRPDLDSTGGAAEFVELDRSECLSLLTRGDVGRVVFTDAAMPAAHPVKYVLDGEEILFCTGDRRTFAATHGAVIGFEADDFDRESHTGWCVLGIGRAHEVLDPDRLAAGMPAASAPGRTLRIVAVPLQYLTGRRLRLFG